MKLVSFYADTDGDTFYSDSAKKLKTQCSSLGVDCSINERDFGNTWIDNVRAKPVFLLQMLEELGESFVWLDCDSQVLKPIDFKIKSDWGVYLREDGTPHDFVHYVSNTPNAKKFLEKWVSAINDQQRGSHTAFISIFDSIDSEVLPGGYFEIGLADTESKSQYFKNH